MKYSNNTYKYRRNNSLEHHSTRTLEKAKQTMSLACTKHKHEMLYAKNEKLVSRTFCAGKHSFLIQVNERCFYGQKTDHMQYATQFEE